MTPNEPMNDEVGSAPCYLYQFGRFHLRVEENGQALFSDGHAIALSTAESTILRVLLEKNGQFVKTDELLKFVSQSPMASENLVHGAVRGLRRTLNDSDLIRNERSKGYSFTGDVKRQDADFFDPGSQIVDSMPRPIAQVSDHQRDPFVIVALLITAPVVLLPFG